MFINLIIFYLIIKTYNKKKLLKIVTNINLKNFNFIYI